MFFGQFVEKRAFGGQVSFYSLQNLGFFAEIQQRIRRLRTAGVCRTHGWGKKEGTPAVSYSEF